MSHLYILQSKHVDEITQQKELALSQQLHESVQGLLKLEQKTDSKRPAAAAPKSKSLIGTKGGADDARSQIAQVPIDEVDAIGIKVSPTFGQDDIQSVTLKSFRKVIGYDTFESILKEERNEKKDPADYYNVTVSMMIKRNPAMKATFDKFMTSEGKTLGQVIDKGFPYDDADSTLTESIKKVNLMSVGTIVGKLNGENVTKEALISLLKDKTSPVTQSLAQVSSSSQKNDFALLDNNVSVAALKNLLTDHPAPITLKLAQKNDFSLLDNNVSVAALKNLVTDHPAPITLKLAQKNDFALLDNNVSVAALKNLVTDHPAPITLKLAQTEKNDFALLDNNVTVSALKNLLTDHPAPITLKLAQTEKNDFALLDNNVTVSALKNLLTDHPAPITLKLAQIEKSDYMNLAQTPITVNPESMMSENMMASAKLGLDKVRVGPDEFNLGQKDATNVQLNAENPVWNPPFNNWSVNQPSPPHDHGDKGDQDLELRDIIIDGVNGYDLVQTRQRNPVWNPPFNNWSVNQPSPPHDHGLPAYQDLGQNIIVDGHAIHYAQKSDPRNFV